MIVDGVLGEMQGPTSAAGRRDGVGIWRRLLNAHRARTIAVAEERRQTGGSRSRLAHAADEPALELTAEYHTFRI
ncbi:hypothetical protein DK847_19995 [Aestuariivirga litoralis]|uniref:Uncharacterized protein n=1 Tax=Aestuariivirga litoralis TaxID=2650924 RepID=A0A2W2ANI1_9HYPH|nr:hypothetical protein DK847_19995 [Aestuariivirga litoralis]